MKVVTTTEPGAIEIAERADPTATVDSVVRLDNAGICGTDLKILHGKIPVARPRVMGHEMVGIVEHAAADGEIPAGTRVLVNPATSCGTCDLCRRHLPHLCRRGGLLGRDSDGVFAERLAVAERYLHVVPAGISGDAAGVLQVLGTVVHAQRTVQVFPDHVAVVVGLGISGLLHLQMLLARGVGTVIGITRSQWKLDLATTFGAHGVATPDAAAEVVAETTGGRGADLVVECVGQEATLAQAIELAGHGADVVVFGTSTGGGQGLPYYQLYFKELTLHNPRAATGGDYDTGIALAATARLTLEPLVTGRFALADAVAAFEAAADPAHLKVLLHSG